MNPQRLSQATFNEANAESAEMKPAFFMLSVAPANESQASSMQSLYQQLYAQALQANQLKRTPDLFAVMN